MQRRCDGLSCQKMSSGIRRSSFSTDQKYLRQVNLNFSKFIVQNYHYENTDNTNTYACAPAGL